MLISEHICNVHNARTRVVPTNPLKADPTRSKMLRRALEIAFRRRFNNLRRAVFDLVAVEDAFGLRKTLNEEQKDGTLPTRSQITRAENRRATTSNRGEAGAIRQGVRIIDGGPTGDSKHGGEAGSTNKRANNYYVDPDKVVGNQRFRFQSTPEQLKSFQAWLKTQIDLDVLQGGALNPEDAYWTTFVEEGYKKGQGRAFSDSRPAALASKNPESLAFYQGTKDEFLRSSFGSPVAIEKVKILSARVFTELEGVTSAMSQSITRELIDGISRGENPSVIARRMQDNIDKIGKRRATLIARTEITRAHAEGQLDAMELLGVEKVGVAVEWSTAGDDRVCFLAGTMVSVENGSVPIEGLQVGNLVWTRQGLKPIIAVSSRSYSGDLVAIQTTYTDEVEIVPCDGYHHWNTQKHSRIISTDKHPFCRDADSEGPEKWVEAKDLCVGDRLISRVREKIKVTHICPFDMGEVVVYNIQVADCPEFFANDILVHNCLLCQPLEGVVMSLKEARGIIPRHLQCRCAFIPANVGEDQADQIRSKGGIDSALSKSLGKERPKFKYKEVPGQFTPTGKPVRKRVGKNRETIKQAKKRSAWVGADKRISKKRPKGIV